MPWLLARFSMDLMPSFSRFAVALEQNYTHTMLMQPHTQDSLMLLAEGHLIYSGPAQDVVGWMGGFGLQVPYGTSTAGVLVCAWCAGVDCPGRGGVDGRLQAAGAVRYLHRRFVFTCVVGDWYGLQTNQQRCAEAVDKNDTYPLNTTQHTNTHNTTQHTQTLCLMPLWARPA